MTCLWKEIELKRRGNFARNAPVVFPYIFFWAFWCSEINQNEEKRTLDIAFVGFNDVEYSRRFLLASFLLEFQVTYIFKKTAIKVLKNVNDNLNADLYHSDCVLLKICF